MSPEDRGSLFLKHQKAVIRTIQRQYSYIDEDTLGNLYNDLWFAIARLDRLSCTTFKTLLTTALRNAVKNYIRDASRSQDVLSRFEILSLSTPEVVEAADTYSFATRTYIPAESCDHESEWYEAVMADLPPTLRLIVEMYHIDGKTQEDIACHFQTNRTKIVRLINKANELVKELYLKHAAGVS